MKAKTKAGIVALDRSMIALVRELRVAGARPLANSAEDATVPPLVKEETPEPSEIEPATARPAEAEMVPVKAGDNEPARLPIVRRDNHPLPRREDGVEAAARFGHVPVPMEEPHFRTRKVPSADCAPPASIAL